MLYDWNTVDSVTGQRVSSMADSDLATLSQNGFNLVHLYVWDQALLKQANPGEYSGFVSAPGNPSQSPNSQWANLNDFVTRAENHGLFVALHFASGYILSNINTPGSATTYATWVGQFIQYLNSTNRHQNVLLWGMAYSLDPAAGQPTNNYSIVWSQVYYQVDMVARQYSPQPGVLGLIGTDLPWGMAGTGVIVRGSGYVFQWQAAQQTAYTMRQLLTSLYGTTKDPDIYLIQVYYANSSDAYNALYDLVTSTSVHNGMPIQSAKTFVVEFATSSAMGSTGSTGTNVPSYGDNQTPVTTVTGQSAWLQNTLCLMVNTRIQKFAYWAMFDPYTLWSTAPWSYTGQALSWNGFWGVAYEEPSSNKPSWPVLQSYYLNGSLTCPGLFGYSPAYATPIMSLTPTSTYYTTSQPIRVTWTAAEAASISLNDGNDGTYACDTGAQLSSALVSASCAYTDATGFSTTGTPTVTVTGVNLQGGPSSASATVTVGSAPVVNAVTNQNYSKTIHVNDTMIVWGNGFSLAGGNKVQLSRTGYQTVTFSETDGLYFWDKSNFQINAALGGRLATGTWTLNVYNGYSPNPSAGFQVTINP